MLTKPRCSRFMIPWSTRLPHGLGLILLLLTMAALHGQAQTPWTVSDRATPTALPAGATLHRFTVHGANDADFQVVQFDAQHCTLRVVDQPVRAKAVSLAQAMPGIGAIAGTNGGFFTPEFAPLGLCISNGQRVGEWTRSSLLGGVIAVKRGRLLLLWRDEFQSSDGVTELLQAGPRLVNHGQPITGLEKRNSRPRTFIATDNAGRWLLGIAQSTTLENLAQMLATPGLVPGFELERALNFDGGKSTGFWAQQADGKIVSDAEFTTVRNFVAVVPRKAR